MPGHFRSKMGKPRVERTFSRPSPKRWRHVQCQLSFSPRDTDARRFGANAFVCIGFLALEWHSPRSRNRPNRMLQEMAFNLVVITTTKATKELLAGRLSKSTTTPDPTFFALFEQLVLHTQVRRSGRVHRGALLANLNNLYAEV